MPPALPRPPGCFLCLPTRPWPALTWPRFFRFFFRSAGEGVRRGPGSEARDPARMPATPCWGPATARRAGRVATPPMPSRAQSTTTANANHVGCRPPPGQQSSPALRAQPAIAPCHGLGPSQPSLPMPANLRAVIVLAVPLSLHAKEKEGEDGVLLGYAILPAAMGCPGRKLGKSLFVGPPKAPPPKIPSPHPSTHQPHQEPRRAKQAEKLGQPDSVSYIEYCVQRIAELRRHNAVFGGDVRSEWCVEGRGVWPAWLWDPCARRAGVMRTAMPTHFFTWILCSI